MMLDFRRVVFLAFILSGCHGDPQCPWGYTFQHDNSCYLISHDKADWIGAVSSCHLMRGQLVEIDNAGESQYIHDIASQNRAPDIYWIGLTNKRDKAQWNWAESQQPARGRYENWAPGEPDNYSGDRDESCVLIDDVNNHGYKWADAECQRLQKYICEWMQPVIPTPGIVG